MPFCDTNCDKPPIIDVEVVFSEKEKALKPLRFKAFLIESGRSFLYKNHARPQLLYPRGKGAFFFTLGQK